MGAERDPHALPSETTTRYRLLRIAAFFIPFSVVSAIVGFLGSESSAFLYLDGADQLAIDFAGIFLWWLSRTGSGILAGCLSLLYISLHYRYHAQASINAASKGAVFDVDPSFTEGVRTLAEQNQLPVPHAVFINKQSKLMSGFVAGVPGRFAVFLDSSPTPRQKPAVNRRAFRAVVLHELAHIDAQDIRHGYAAISANNAIIFMMACVSIITIPVTLSAAWEHIYDLGDVRGMIEEFWKGFLATGFFGVFLVYTSKSLLRYREMYADIKADKWSEGDLQAYLRRLIKRKAKEPVASGLRGLFGNHPSHAQRLEVLQEPARLMRLEWDLPVLTGVTIALIFPGMMRATVDIAFFLVAVLRVLPTKGTALGVVLLLLAAIGVAILFLGFCCWFLSATLGLHIQRAALARQATRLRLAGIAACFVMGVELGLFFNPLNAWGEHVLFLSRLLADVSLWATLLAAALLLRELAPTWQRGPELAHGLRRAQLWGFGVMSALGLGVVLGNQALSFAIEALLSEGVVLR